MKRGLIPVSALLVLFLLSGCRKEELPVDVSSETETENSGESGTVDPLPEPSAVVTRTEEERTKESEIVAPSGETETEVLVGTFFGKTMPKTVSEINRKTMADPRSGLFDPTEYRSFTATEICDMITAYALPENGMLGNEPLSPELRTELSEMRNLEALYDRSSGISAASPVISPRFAILVENADVRAFPTERRLTATGSAEEHDLLQETVLPFASGVSVLHSDADGRYSFCKGEYYAGWIRTEQLAFTDFGTLKEYLDTDTVIVSFGTDRSKSWNRLGLWLPAVSVDGNAATVRLPKRTAEGTLVFRTETVEGVGTDYHAGFLEFSPEAAYAIALRLVGTPYGWGDESGYYDCSGFTGALYRVFGYVLPRNSSVQSAFGGRTADLSGKNDSEKLEILSRFPGSVISWPGHAMYFRGVTERDGMKKYEVLHETTGWYGRDGVYHKVNGLTVSDLQEMYRYDGSSFLSSILTLVIAGGE